ncbi:MAG TPA: EamA family transporter [Casimicrobiaceae bacterium]|nr:EamA family transporter [Casimicrobiaceae bacterium]
MTPPQSRPALAAAYPALFVVLWSTGFIAAKFGLPYAPPLGFLVIRFACATALLSAIALLQRAAWPHGAMLAHLAVAGLLVHGVYLGGVFIALKQGMEAGTSAMLVGLQPLLTVLLARAWLGEPVRRSQWLGLLLGVIGVYMVVRHKIAIGREGLIAALVALAAISIGTLYQKRHCARVDIRTGAAVQFLVCAIVFAPLALTLEREAVQFTGSFVFALGWSVVVLSVGAISLLYWLLRHGAAANVARLFYLVPPVTALMAFALFGERLELTALFGMVMIAGGVALSGRR